MGTREQHGPAVLEALILIMLLYLGFGFGFMKVEGWDTIDTIYFITFTLTTVGFGDPAPQTELGKLMAVALMWIGVSIAIYLLYSIQQYFIYRYFWQRRISTITEMIRPEKGYVTGKYKNKKFDLARIFRIKKI